MNYIVLDTETTNGFDDPICYDVGWAVLDDNFEPIVTRSFIVADIFLDEKDMMEEAFFADKIPQYKEDANKGLRQFKTFKTIRNILREDARKYDVKSISAHNARFDYKSCTTTQRWLTSSKYRYFFPFGIEIWDTLKMARQVFATDENYIHFCRENEYTLKNGYPRLTAEIIYRYISGDNSFEEKHTGLEDVLIEKEILKYCLNSDADIKCKLWD